MVPQRLSRSQDQEPQCGEDEDAQTHTNHPPQIPTPRFNRYPYSEHCEDWKPGQPPPDDHEPCRLSKARLWPIHEMRVTQNGKLLHCPILTSPPIEFFNS